MDAPPPPAAGRDDIRVETMADELSRCDTGGALDICCRELRDDIEAVRAKLREYDARLRELLRKHESISCAAHEISVKATMATRRGLRPLGPPRRGTSRKGA